MWQELADVLEATVWERVRATAGRRAWKVVAEEMVSTLETSWPSALCSVEQAAAIGFKLEASALAERFRTLAKKAGNMERIRAKACRIIAKSGQIAAPPPEMTLWQFFKPTENVLVNKGGLAAKERSLAQHRQAAQAQKNAAKMHAKKKSDPTSAVSSSPLPPPTPSPAAETAEAATPGTETLAGLLQAGSERVQLPGLRRGSAAGLTDGRGRGGAVQRALKVAVRDLVVEDHVPIRDVPKVLCDAQVALTQQLPQERELITHSHISDWISELGAEDMLDELARFWAVRREFGPLVVLHVAHDGSRRTDRKLGRHGELMQFLCSYYNPRIDRAVEFLLSFRFTVGGSAAHTARALAVCLADAGVYRIAASLDPRTAFRVSVLQKGVLFDLGTDNTGSAINVSSELQVLTGEPCGNWPCPTHINALDGKTPIQELTGDAGTDYDSWNALNIASKWWYVCDKHMEIIQHWWPKLKCSGGVGAAIVKSRPLMGKWESMGAANSIVFTAAAGIRAFVVGMEYYSTGIPGLGSFKQDCKSLAQWMHDPELWFHFLVCHDWFTRTIDPIFTRLRSRCSWIHPESGPHLGRQVVPRLALNAICRAYDLPDSTSSDAVIDAKAMQYIPNAHAHAYEHKDDHLRAAGSWCRFQIPSQDRLAYLRAWATKFTPKLRQNADKHWRPFLQRWKVAGLATDPELGVFVARHLLKLATGDARLGGEPDALPSTLLGPNLDLHVAEINRLMAADGGQIAAALAKDGLFDTPAKRADWVSLCAQPPARGDIDWTRKTLPELAPWF